MIFERGHFKPKMINESVIADSYKNAQRFNESIKSITKPTLFLSHKHDDLADLMGVIEFLENFGVKIYIDSMDKKMPDVTSGETALRIKNEIKICKKFILLATEKAIESYWCNWELGIGDTYKYPEHIAILPMKEQGSLDIKYKGNEYLQIYSSIDYMDGSRTYSDGNRITAGFYLCNPYDKDKKRTITPLQKWLNN